MLPIEERITELRHRYTLSLPDRFAALRSAFLGDGLNQRRTDLLRRFHTLAGSAATFGFDDIAALAADAECTLAAASLPMLTPPETEYLTSCVAGLEQALRRYLGDEPAGQQMGRNEERGGDHEHA